MRVVLKNWYLIIMIDKMHIDCDRCIAMMMMIMITTLTFEKMSLMISKGIKRDEYGDFKKKFKTNNENRR